MTIFLLFLTTFCFHLSHCVPFLIPNVTVEINNNVGHYTNISNAIQAAPTKSIYRYVIYIKEGVYFENVHVPAEKSNITLVGDGKGRTIISGNLNEKIPGVSIQNSATLKIDGFGFLAINLTVRNTAGAKGGPAVAIHSSSKNSAFYRLSIEGFQDTLYIQTGPQFYRECDIYGTVDFIFGEGPAVFQKCQILAKQSPIKNQKNAITANGCLETMSSCGFSFHQCNITGDSELLRSKLPTPTYLGRPWKNGSITVFMKSYMTSVINPTGWLDWPGKHHGKTMFYAEFENSGEGAVVNNRAKWPEIHHVINKRTAEKFTVSTFLNGGIWLPNLGVPYIPGLL